jgi:PAS domain-containing protein
MNSIVVLSVVLAAAVVALCLISGLRSRRAEELLRGRNILLNGALNNMTQGLNMFDSAGNLVLSNARYIEMYGLPAGKVQPGVTVRDLVDLRLAAGTFFKTDPQQYAQELMSSIVERKPTRVTRELADGRSTSRWRAAAGW